MRNLLYLFFSMFFLSACSTVPSAVIPKSMEPAAGEATGTVFGSIGISRPSALEVKAQKLYFRKIGGSELGSFSYGDVNREMVSVNIRENSFIGNLFHVDLPAGEYEFVQYWFLWYKSYGIGGIASASYMPKSEFSVRFKVEPGKSTYLGEFSAYLDYVGGVNRGIILYPSGGYLGVADRFSRDKDLFGATPGALKYTTYINGKVVPDGVLGPLKEVCLVDKSRC